MFFRYIKYLFRILNERITTFTVLRAHLILIVHYFHYRVYNLMKIQIQLMIIILCLRVFSYYNCIIFVQYAKQMMLLISFVE